MRIVITGVSRGLGRALATRMAADGHTVFGCARCQDVLDELAQQFPPPHAFTRVDVADDSQVARWANVIDLLDDPPDLLFNNAAVINRPAPLWKVPPDEFSQLIDINVKGMFHALRHFIPILQKRGRGVIVNLSSGWGRTTSPEVAPYCASKFAVEGLTQALAQELPPEITTIALNPGIINTDMLQTCWGPDANTFPSPETWAERAADWISKISPALHGQSATIR